MGVPGRDAWHLVRTQKHIFITVLFISFNFHALVNIIYRLRSSDKDSKAQMGQGELPPGTLRDPGGI